MRTVAGTDSDESSDTSKPAASAPTPDPGEESTATPSSEKIEAGASVAVGSRGTHDAYEPSDYESLLPKGDFLLLENHLFSAIQSCPIRNAARNNIPSPIVHAREASDTIPRVINMHCDSVFCRSGWCLCNELRSRENLINRAAIVWAVQYMY